MASSPTECSQGKIIQALLKELKEEKNLSPEAAAKLSILEALITDNKAKQCSKHNNTNSSTILNKFRLDNQVAVVTGGSRGIGYAIAEALGEAGCRVAVASINYENARAAAERLRDEKGIQTLAVQVDVAKKSSVEAMVKTVVDTWGALHIGVNNAGVSEEGKAEEFSEETWDWILSVNLKGVFLCAQAEARIMLEQGYGRIINIGSICGHTAGHPHHEVAYDTSKAGVIHMTKSMAAEWAGKGVTVNCISPGYIDTDMLQEEQWQSFREKWIALIPMGRLARVDELQGTSLLLASSLSSYITGADIIVDGGYVLW